MPGSDLPSEWPEEAKFCSERAPRLLVTLRTGPSCWLGLGELSTVRQTGSHGLVATGPQGSLSSPSTGFGCVNSKRTPTPSLAPGRWGWGAAHRGPSLHPRTETFCPTYIWSPRRA